MPRQVDKTQLGVNYDADVKRRLINVDSRFREDVNMDPDARWADAGSQRTNSTTNFLFRLPAPVRNVLRMRVVSLELPNSAAFISAYLRTNSLILRVVGGSDYLVTIPDGNQDFAGLKSALETALNAGSHGITFVVGFDQNTGEYTIVNNNTSDQFTLIFKAEAGAQTIAPGGVGWPTRPQDFGLGYLLGFRKTSATSATVAGKPSMVSPAIANVGGADYQLLQINDEVSVESTAQNNNMISAAAKLPIPLGPDTIIYNEFSGLLANTIEFTTPKDISVLKCRLVDNQGLTVNLQDLPFSFTLELTEATNAQLYESRRKHGGWDPANVS